MNQVRALAPALILALLAFAPGGVLALVLAFPLCPPSLQPFRQQILYA
jgi:hypothetical protein